MMSFDAIMSLQPLLMQLNFVSKASVRRRLLVAARLIHSEYAFFLTDTFLVRPNRLGLRGRRPLVIFEVRL
jgi:hypothetical protein